MKLMRLCGFGQGKAEFKALLRPHMTLLHGKALSLCASPELADALLQEVLRDLADRVETLRKMDNPAPWIMEVMYRHYLREHREEIPKQEKAAAPQAAQPMREVSHGMF